MKLKLIFFSLYIDCFVKRLSSQVYQENIHPPLTIVKVVLALKAKGSLLFVEQKPNLE